MATLTATRTHGHALRDIDIGAGAAAGIVASLAMGMVVMVVTLIQGRGLFLVPRLIATLVLSNEAAATTIGIITGLVIHVLLGALYGLIFAVLHTLITNSYELSGAIVLGLVYGFGLWVVNFLILGPATGAQLTVQLAPATAIPMHLLFGLVVSLYPLFIRVESRLS